MTVLLLHALIKATSELDASFRLVPTFLDDYLAGDSDGHKLTGSTFDTVAWLVWLEYATLQTD